MSREYRGTASPLAKAVVGPMVDRMMSEGVLPVADFEINESIHDETFIDVVAPPGDPVQMSVPEAFLADRMEALGVPRRIFEGRE